MKRILVLLTVSMLFLTGCSAKVSPEKTVEAFFTSVKSVDFDGVKGTLSPEAVAELEENLDEAVVMVGDEDKVDLKDVEGIDETLEIAKGYLKELNYEVTEALENKDEGTATVTLTATYVDATELYAETFSEFMGRMFGLMFTGGELTEQETIEMIVNVFNEKSKDFEVVTETTEATLNLIKVDGKWLIEELNEDILNIILFGAQDTVNSFNDDNGSIEGEIDFNLE